jgi:hypothetical protein
MTNGESDHNGTCDDPVYNEIGTVSGIERNRQLESRPPGGIQSSKFGRDLNPALASRGHERLVVSLRLVSIS